MLMRVVSSTGLGEGDVCARRMRVSPYSPCHAINPTNLLHSQKLLLGLNELVDPSFRGAALIQEVQKRLADLSQFWSPIIGDLRVRFSSCVFDEQCLQCFFLHERRDRKTRLLSPRPAGGQGGICILFPGADASGLAQKTQDTQ